MLKALIVVAVSCCGFLFTAAAGASRSCGTRHLFRITGYISAESISCSSARQVFVAVERAPLEEEIEETPYGQYSPPFAVNTPVGRVVCRREPFGLGGSEHNIRCARGRQRVRWHTVHD